MTLPFGGAKTATTTEHTTGIDEPAPITLPFAAGGKRVAPVPEVNPDAKVEVITPAVTPEPVPVAQPAPSTFEQGGWRPWDDRRDAAGYDFAEWAENCARVDAGQEPLAPAHPRQRGLFPPVERKPEVAEAEGARKAVTANGVTVTRLDAYKRKPGKKTRDRKAAETGAKYVTARDLAVIEEVIVWGYISRTQVALLLDYTPAGITRRINKLVTLALLDRQYGIDGHFRYTATAAGRRLAGMERMTTPAISMLRWDHHEAVIATALMLKRRFPNAVYVTERELQAASYGPDGKVGSGGTLSPRLMRIAPWLSAQAGSDYSRWSPVIYGKSGTKQGRKRPDLLLVQQGHLGAAIEVELNEKSRRSDYRDVVAAYSEAAASKHLAPEVVYVVSPAAPLSAKRLTALLTEARAKAGVSASSPLRFAIESIPEDVWVPLTKRVRS